MLEQTINWMSNHHKVPLFSCKVWHWFRVSGYEQQCHLPDDICAQMSEIKDYKTLLDAITDLGQALAKLGLISLPDAAKPPSFGEWQRASQCSPGYCNGQHYFISECSPSVRVDPSVRLPKEVFNSLQYGIKWNFEIDYSYCGGNKLSIVDAKYYTSKEAALNDLKQTLRKLGIVSNEPSPDAEAWMKKHNKSPWRNSAWLASDEKEKFCWVLAPAAEPIKVYHLSCKIYHLLKAEDILGLKWYASRKAAIEDLQQALACCCVATNES